MVVISPTRVDLAGGTLDLWPLYTFLGGAVTVNFAIDIFTEVTVEELESPKIIIDLPNVKFKREFNNINDVYKSKFNEVKFIVPHLRYWNQKTGLNILINSQSPVGGGLGGSSSTTVGLCKAFSILGNRHLTDHELVDLAHNLEAQILNKLTGTQDYVPAIRGGLNFIHYNMHGVKFENESFPQELLEHHGFLLYTGQPHHSGLNNWEVIKKAVLSDKETIKALIQLQLIAREMEIVFKEMKWDGLKKLFDLEYKWRLKLSKHFSSTKIEAVKRLVSKKHASVKICGAGGGGCVLIWCHRPNKTEVMEECQSAGFRVFNIKAMESGFKVLMS